MSISVALNGTEEATAGPDRRVLVIDAGGSRRVGTGCRRFLERAIEAELLDFREGVRPLHQRDRVVVWGARIAAIIRRGPGGRADVVRFDPTT